MKELSLKGFDAFRRELLLIRSGRRVLPPPPGEVASGVSRKPDDGRGPPSPSDASPPAVGALAPPADPRELPPSRRLRGTRRDTSL